MKKNLNFLYFVGACLMSGALVIFYLTSRSSSINESVFTGLFFSVVLFLTLYFIHQFIIRKLKIFSGLQAILHQSFLYVIVLTFTSLASFIFFTMIKATTTEIKDFVYNGIIKGFVYLITLPFTDDQSISIISPQMRGILFTIPMMIFLIGIVSIISSFIEIKWKEIKQKQLIADAELKALQAQIEPHFLFNSLNTIVSIVKTDPEKAEKLLIKLSDLLRYLFSIGNKIKFSLKDELIFTKNYLSLMQARFTNNLQVTWDENISNNEHQVPALIFQPVIENAIKHGWQDKSREFFLTINVESLNDLIYVEINDNGVGINQEKLKKLPIKGHALENLTERLFLEYQKNNLLQIDSQPNIGTKVKIKIPVKK